MPDVAAGMGMMNTGAAGVGGLGGLAALLSGAASGVTGENAGLADGQEMFSQLLAAADSTTAMTTTLSGAAGDGVVAGNEVVTVPLVTSMLVDKSATKANGAKNATAKDALQLSMSGTAADVTELMARVEQMSEALKKAGFDVTGLTDALLDGSGEDQLAAAFEVLGMSPAEAKIQAERVQQALDLAKQKMELTDQQAGMVAGLMMAAVAGQVVGEVAGTTENGADGVAQGVTGDGSLNIQIKNVEVQANQVSVYAASATTAAGSDMLRTMIGLDGKSASKNAAVDGAALADTTDVAEPNVSLTLFDDGFALTDGEAVLASSAVVETKVKQSVAQTVVATAAAPAVAMVSGAEKMALKLNDVAAENVIAKPQGDVMYRWRADGSGDSTGVDSVEATPAVHKTMESLLNTSLAKAEAGAAPNMLVSASATNGYDVALDASGSGGKGFDSNLSGLSQFTDRMAGALRADSTHQVMVQMQQVAATAGTPGHGTVRMTLNPVELGEITIDLQIQKDGTVSGTIAASDHAVVEVLAREVHQLRLGLADAGLKLGQEGISLMLSSSGQQGSGQGGNNEHAGTSHSGMDTLRAGDHEIELTDIAENPAAWVSPDRVVDVRV